MEEPPSESRPFAPELIGPAPILCPHCGESLAIQDLGERQVPACPACQLEFVVGENDEPAPPDEDDLINPDELDGMRIRQLVQLRRGAIRARTYAIIIMLCCLVMGVQLIFTDIQEVHSYGWDRWAILYAVLAGVMVVVATIARRKAGVLHLESRTSATPVSQPESAPHFDQLGDGSHQVKNLETMAEKHGE